MEHSLSAKVEPVLDLSVVKEVKAVPVMQITRVMAICCVLMGSVHHPHVVKGV